VTLTLSTRPGCHLCDEMKVVLQRVGTQLSFALEEVDISLNVMLTQRYGHDIPVLVVDGIEIARHRIGEAKLMQRLLDRMPGQTSNQID